jgi:hypothetical protein
MLMKHIHHEAEDAGGHVPVDEVMGMLSLVDPSSNSYDRYYPLDVV